MGASANIERTRDELRRTPRRWLVTGAAGFIGSHLVEELLGLNQSVTGLDNLSTGSLDNLHAVERIVGADAWNRFEWIEGDICEESACERAVSGVDFVLHQAALGSVPRSIEDPLATDRANVVGFLVLLRACVAAKVRRFVYASSSSVYGDNPDQVKIEDRLGNPLSPYAASKRADEIYAQAFSSAYGISCIGIRYFNVFGPRQNPDGPYAAVIPRWLDALMRGQACTIFGDGETTRDFCYVANAVQANVLAACSEEQITHAVFNAACGERTSLRTLYALLELTLRESFNLKPAPEPNAAPFRAGDVRNSLADISRAANVLGYAPSHRLQDGIRLLVEYLRESGQKGGSAAS